MSNTVMLLANEIVSQLRAIADPVRAESENSVLQGNNQLPRHWSVQLAEAGEKAVRGIGEDVGHRCGDGALRHSFGEADI